MDKITLEINGETCEVSAVTNARELLQFLGITEQRVALEINHRIIRRAEWDSAKVTEGDRVEIVQFVGGG
jgi:thiamine biosynthesis protein ThiS